MSRAHFVLLIIVGLMTVGLASLPSLSCVEPYASRAQHARRTAPGLTQNVRATVIASGVITRDDPQRCQTVIRIEEGQFAEQTSAVMLPVGYCSMPIRGFELHVDISNFADGNIRDVSVRQIYEPTTKRILK